MIVGDYKGFSIDFDNVNGLFTAYTDSGKGLVSDTYDGIKERISNAIQLDQPIDVIFFDRNSPFCRRSQVHKYGDVFYENSRLVSDTIIRYTPDAESLLQYLVDNYTQMIQRHGEEKDHMIQLWKATIEEMRKTHGI